VNGKTSTLQAKRICKDQEEEAAWPSGAAWEQCKVEGGGQKG
jgi:hypothetical protein